MVTAGISIGSVDQSQIHRQPQSIMSNATHSNAVSSPESVLPTNGAQLARRLLIVAWMSIILGLAVELLLVIVAAVFGTAGDAKPFVADAAQKVSWSVMVCAGLTLGTAARPSIRAESMAILRLLSAPTAFIVAKMIHRAVSQGLGLEVAFESSPVYVVVLKAFEYGSLGFAAGWLSTKAWASIWTHAALGLITGMIFGGALVGYTLTTLSSVPPAAHLVGVAVNELIYPAGCAVILYAAGTLGTRLALDRTHDG